MGSISRIDSRTTHGWQVKLGGGAGSKLFSDSKHGGKQRARMVALRWLVRHSPDPGGAGAATHPRARLTVALVVALRKGIKSGELNLASWAKRRGVSFSAAYRAAVGQTWKHVQRERPARARRPR